ncbi:MAG TPA: indolepyruvate ferredoxin oxidoreductase subunit alpha [Candidatus Lokiarchaeia archaeon]|nr:indolepyruvate ferredoxin oxidoreductase subunit alpha [Candidatus Lokiarchaeia archaeon]
MSFDTINKVNTQAFLFCNDAIIRGALEADVKVVAFYPGSPVSEILDGFYQVCDKFEIEMEIASNEKVALEIVAGASFAGQRSFTSMKSVGLNVASDAFFSLAYVGVNKGCVLLFADDPFCHSSQTEEDGRFFGPSAYIPMLEPTNPDEARRMVKHAFELSEKFSTVVALRTTTRINHQSAIVDMEPMQRTPFTPSNFRDSTKTFATVGAKARELKALLLEKIKKIKEEFETSPFNEIHDGTMEDTSDRLGIIVSGASYNYVLEAVEKLGIDPAILKLGTTFPLPEALMRRFIENLDTVVIVEELSPYLEVHVKALAKDVNPRLRIIGKESGHFAEAGEFNVPIVVDTLASVTGKDQAVDYQALLARRTALKDILPPRIPVFCPGCPHRATFWALQRAMAGKEGKLAFMNDIGCYSMLLLNAGLYSKIHADDELLSMGSCLGTGTGVSLATRENNLVLSVIGDSTFFHAGLPGMLNIANNQDNVKVLILDNSVTAMTGQQPNAGTGYGPGGKPKKRVEIEDVVKALGFERIIIVDPYDTKQMVEDIKPVFDEQGPAVIISRGPCALWHDRNLRREGMARTPYRVDNTICRKCHTCMRDFYCPAISMEEEESTYVDDNGRELTGFSSNISSTLCDGCGVCSILCPYTDHENRSVKDVIKPLISPGETP